jgi:predicted AlkP superfamily phosphohydrolase/phosphomutase
MSVNVLVIGLDGATFSVLDPLVEQGVMPNLARFFADGVRAPLRTIVPALTPPAWTSLMTGRTPGHHGVFDFFRMDSPETRHIRFATSRDVSTETMWGLADRQGRRVTALNFPLMFPAPRVNGYVVPGWVPWRQLRLACSPAGLFDELKQLPGFEPRELAMDIKLEEKATEGCSDAGQYAPWIEFHIRREQNWLRILEHLHGVAPSHLTAVLFDGVDKLQHLCWRFIDPAEAASLTEPWERRARELCLEYFRRLDGIIGRACALAGESATVVIASDHGFGPTRDVFHVNAWLESKGLLAWSDRARQDAAPDAMLGVGQVARHTYLLDWSRTKAFAATPTSNGIFIVIDRDGRGEGVAPDEYQAFRERLRRDLLAFRDAEGRPVVIEAWTRDEVFAGPHGGTAPDLTLVMRDGGLVSILPGDPLVRPRPQLAGAHRPDGVFAVKGPGIRQGVRHDGLSILDVAPIVLHGLGLAVPADLEGRVPEELFEAEAWRVRPALVGAPTNARAAAEEEAPVALAPEDEAVVVERLQQLGYID